MNSQQLKGGVTCNGVTCNGLAFRSGGVAIYSLLLHATETGITSGTYKPVGSKASLKGNVGESAKESESSRCAIILAHFTVQGFQLIQALCSVDESCLEAPARGFRDT